MHSYIRLSVVAAILLAIAGPAAAQQRPRAYEPSTRLPTDATRELVLVFISHSASPANEDGSLARAVRQAKSVLAERSRVAEHAFSAIGVAMDATVAAGIDYLVDGRTPFGTMDFGLWDEIHAGHGWLNSSVVRFIHRDFPSMPAASVQLLILEHSLQVAEAGIKVGPDRVLARVIGQAAIVGWVERGLPLADAK